MMSLKIIIILSACLMQLHGKGLNMLSSRIMQDSLTVEGNNVADYVTITTKMYNAGTLDAYFNFDADIIKELPPDVFLVFKVEKLNTNRDVYEATPFSIEKNYCRYMKMDKLIYPIILSKGTFPRKCPVLPGLYVIRNFTVNPEDLPVSAPLGTYRITFAFRYQNRSINVVWKGRSMQD